jgi:hypothetical protein
LKIESRGASKCLGQYTVPLDGFPLLKKNKNKNKYYIMYVYAIPYDNFLV